MNTTLSPVKSLLLNFEGDNKIQGSFTVDEKNYKNAKGLIEKAGLEIGSKKLKFLSIVEGDEPYDWSDCLIEDQTLDTEFLNKIFEDKILDDKLNLLISEELELTMQNLEQIQEFDEKKEKISFPKFILKETTDGHGVVKDPEVWLQGMYQEGKIIAMTASNDKVIYAFTEAEEDKEEKKDKEEKEKDKEDEKKE